ncbi:MAG: hypothetical protein J6Y53_05370 [Alphaproteobacteria bacterium]|nr:hypothetical protein [Alphaproteobacteria bacterium]
MKPKILFLLSMVCATAATAICFASFCVLWVDNGVDEPLHSLTSVLSIALTLAPLVLAIIFSGTTTTGKKAKSTLIPMAAVTLVGNILGLVLLECTGLPKPFFTAMYGFLAILNGGLLCVSIAFYDRFR